MRIYHAILSLRFTRTVGICCSRENRLKRVILTRLFAIKLTIEYKVAEKENVDWDLFAVQYLSLEEIQYNTIQYNNNTLFTHVASRSS